MWCCVPRCGRAHKVIDLLNLKAGAYLAAQSKVLLLKSILSLWGSDFRCFAMKRNGECTLGYCVAPTRSCMSFLTMLCG